MVAGDDIRALVSRWSDDLALSLSAFATRAGLHHKTLTEPIENHPERPWLPHKGTIAKLKAYYDEEIASRKDVTLALRPAANIREAALLVSLRATGMQEYTPEQMVELARRVSRHIEAAEAEGRPLSDAETIAYARGVFEMLVEGKPVSDC